MHNLPLSNEKGKSPMRPDTHDGESVPTLSTLPQNNRYRALDTLSVKKEAPFGKHRNMAPNSQQPHQNSTTKTKGPSVQPQEEVIILDSSDEDESPPAATNSIRQKTAVPDSPDLDTEDSDYDCYHAALDLDCSENVGLFVNAPILAHNRSCSGPR